MPTLRLLLVGIPLALSAGASAISACSSKTDEAAPLNIQDGGDTFDSGTHPTPDSGLVKPPPTPRHGRTTSDAKPPPPPPTPKDGGGSDAKLGDADLPDSDPGEGGITATP